MYLVDWAFVRKRVLEWSHLRRVDESRVPLGLLGTRWTLVGHLNVRIAHLNTLRQGLSDSRRSASIKRLLAAASADTRERDEKETLV